MGNRYKNVEIKGEEWRAAWKEFRKVGETGLMTEGQYRLIAQALRWSDLFQAECPPVIKLICNECKPKSRGKKNGPRMARIIPFGRR